MKAMKEALAKKRQKGLDLTIIIGAPKDGLLPDKIEHALPAHLSHGAADEEQDKELIDEEIAKSDAMKGSPQEELGEVRDEEQGKLDNESMKKDLLGSMSEHEKMDLKHRKPRSLADRVRMAALEKA